MKRLIECVPNFSEGRDAAKVDAIVVSMSKVPGVYVLDREMDADHNRSVVTLAGDPSAVAEAALLGVGKALELIDLTKHSGAHPRIGATDVVPFIPIEGFALEDCVALARLVGEEIWKRYRIPVYFYEAAATRPERLAAAANPFLRSQSTAASTSPLVSVSAFLQSIMPAPVFSRRSLTSPAVIAAIEFPLLPARRGRAAF